MRARRTAAARCHFRSAMAIRPAARGFHQPRARHPRPGNVVRPGIRSPSPASRLCAAASGLCCRIRYPSRVGRVCRDAAGQALAGQSFGELGESLRRSAPQLPTAFPYHVGDGGQGGPRIPETAAPRDLRRTGRDIRTPDRLRRRVRSATALRVVRSSQNLGNSRVARRQWTPSPR
jgi:hypothetical protein